MLVFAFGAHTGRTTYLSIYLSIGFRLHQRVEARGSLGRVFEHRAHKGLHLSFLIRGVPKEGGGGNRTR